MPMIQQRLELFEELDEYDAASYAILKPENDKLVWSVSINQSKLKAVFGRVPKDILVTIITNM